MRAGVWNLGFGLVAIAAGASGRFVLPFTHDPRYLMGLGAVIAAWGAFQMWQSRSR